jgi:hypothetical protein
LSIKVEALVGESFHFLPSDETKASFSLPDLAASSKSIQFARLRAASIQNG